MGIEGFKGGLLSALIIASLILSVSHVALAQEEPAVFSLSPSDFTEEDVPIGEMYRLERKLVIRNGDTITRYFVPSVQAPPPENLELGYEPIPNENWIILTTARIEIEANSWGEVEMWTSIPRWENLTDKRWEAWISIKRIAVPGEVVELELISKAKIVTTEELPPLPRSVEVSISPGSRSGLPGTSFSYTVTVKNTGSIDDTYTLSAVGAEGWSVSIEPTSLILAAGATGEATLSVVVPPDAEEGTVMTTTVSARSEGDPTVIETDTCGTIVTFLGPPPPLYLTISEENFTLQVGESKYLTATLTYGHNVIKGETITWSATAGTIAPSSGKTDTAGQVSVVYTAPSYETYVVVSASYAGSEQYESSSVNSYGTITVPPAGISMELVIAIAIVIGCAIIGAAILLAKRR